MKPLTDSKHIYEVMSRFKKANYNLITNFFLNPSQTEDLVRTNKLFTIEGSNYIFIIHENMDFFYLYFITKDMKSLDTGLRRVNVKGKLVCDVVGDEKTTQSIVNIFKDHGFTNASVFRRMVLLDQPVQENKRDDTDVEFAEIVDGKEIYSILYDGFDKYSEHLPTLDEIYKWIIDGTILIIKKNTKIIGLLIYEKKGVTTTGKFYYVDENFRGQHIGSRLMRRYLYECRGLKRFLLWVEKSNYRAIASHTHFGYVNEAIVDWVMIK